MCVTKTTSALLFVLNCPCELISSASALPFLAVVRLPSSALPSSAVPRSFSRFLSYPSYCLGKRIMGGFKNRYMIMEVFLNPNRENLGGTPLIITQFNVTKAIKDSILVNFGVCGLATAMGSFEIRYVNPITNLCIIRASTEDYEKVWSAITMVKSIAHVPVIFNLLDITGSKRSCQNLALKCETSKFEQYKLTVGDQLKDDEPKHVFGNGLNSSSALSSSRPYTSFEVISGHLWRRVCKVKNEGNWSQKTRVTALVNCTNRAKEGKLPSQKENAP
ncbi:hypothetical protein PIB30_013096 [Stylosanthes scabra]|uniref:Uncharacterized protein n=1 Tax=Stylosanthes scabra TaxID=79078 RepID=A0ABU6V4M4_9FABA|nr:hypothetical protein [Stylosanthes scabra]